MGQMKDRDIRRQEMRISAEGRYLIRHRDAVTGYTGFSISRAVSPAQALAQARFRMNSLRPDIFPKKRAVEGDCATEIGSHLVVGVVGSITASPTTGEFGRLYHFLRQVKRNSLDIKLTVVSSILEAGVPQAAYKICDELDINTRAVDEEDGELARRCGMIIGLGDLDDRSERQLRLGRLMGKIIVRLDAGSLTAFI